MGAGLCGASPITVLCFCMEQSKSAKLYFGRYLIQGSRGGLSIREEGLFQKSSMVWLLLFTAKIYAIGLKAALNVNGLILKQNKLELEAFQWNISQNLY